MSSCPSLSFSENNYTGYYDIKRQLNLLDLLEKTNKIPRLLLLMGKQRRQVKFCSGILQAVIMLSMCKALYVTKFKFIQHVYLPPLWDLLAPIVETRLLELAMSLLDFSPRIPLGTISIFLEDMVCL